MSRTRPNDYAGACASKKLTLTDVPALDSRWVVQPKLDGWYTRIETDRSGRIRHVTSRSGQTVPLAMSGHLFGAWIGWGDSVIHGELVGQLVHAFDVSQADGVRVADRPYKERRDILWRMQSEVVAEQPERSWVPIQGLRARDKATGAFVRAKPEHWELMKIVDQVPVARWSTYWDRVVAGELEGIVVVNTAAKLGARMAKVKCKLKSTLDATVLRVEPKGLIAWWPGGNRVLTVPARKGVEAKVGEVVEIEHEGYYDDGLPRFARLSPRGVRHDLSPIIPLHLGLAI